jgi:fatty acid desaturase
MMERAEEIVAMRAPSGVEWPTLALVAACHGAFALGLLGWSAAPVAATALLAVAVAFHASLQHEVMHGHPTGRRRLDEALVWPAYGLVVPYERYRDTHLAHHCDATLTDPYDDPESNYLDPAVWARLPWVLRGLLRLNNTLAGRLAVGPLVSQVRFMAGDLRAALAGDRRVVGGWLRHLPPLALVLGCIAWAPMPFWAYGVAVYGGLSLLRIRSFLEHVAHDRASARTAIVEDRGPLALLFLNNNLHVVHHMHPGVPWYRLPALYRARREHYLRRNGGYRLAGYGEVFRRHLWSAKDPVPHPLMEAVPAGRAEEPRGAGVLPGG